MPFPTMTLVSSSLLQARKMNGKSENPDKHVAGRPFEIENVFGHAKSGFLAPVLWIALLAWVARVTVLVRRRAGQEFAVVDIYAGIQIGIVALALLLLLVNLRSIFMLPRIARTSVLALFIYYLISALSALWSPMPQFTMYRAFEFMILLMGVLVALSYSPNFVKAERIVLVISLIVIILSMYVNVRIRQFSASLITSTSAWHTNSYSASAAIVFCYCLGEYFASNGRRKKRLKWFGLFAFGSLILGTSSASFVATLCGILLIALLYRKLALWVVCIWTSTLVFLLMLFVATDFSIFMHIVFPGKSEAAIMTLHGRLPMWRTLFELVRESPIIGHGFAVLSTGRGQVFANDPHNSLFSVLLGTGSLGVITVLFYTFRLLREFFQTSMHQIPGAVGCAAAICTGLVNSLAMPLVFDEWEESSLVFACMTAHFVLFVLLPYRQKRREE